MAFLEVITRTFKRPGMLMANMASLPLHTPDELVQRLLVDPVGRGVGWANARLADVNPRADWVWILDDDDECIRPSLLAELQEIAAADKPELIMMRMDHGPRGVLPDKLTWGLRPTHGRIGCSAFVTRADVWMRHRHVWAGGRYYSDYEFIAAAWDACQSVYWHDVVASRVQRISLGMPE